MAFNFWKQFLKTDGLPDLPKAPTNPDEQQTTLTVTTADGPSTDEVDITEISSDDSSDCILLEQAPGPVSWAWGPEQKMTHLKPGIQMRSLKWRGLDLQFQNPAHPLNKQHQHLHHQLLQVQAVQMRAIYVLKGNYMFT